MRAGKAAGCFTIAVTTGPIPREAFEKEGADMIFPSMDAFADWLESRLGANPMAAQLDAIVASLAPATVTVVTDGNVERDVMPAFASSKALSSANKVILSPGLHRNPS